MQPQKPNLIRSHNTIGNRRTIAAVKFAERFAVVLAIIAFGFFAVQAVRFYQEERSWGSLASVGNEEQVDTAETALPESSEISQEQSAESLPASPTQNAPRPAGAAGGSGSGSACGNNAIPASACTAIQSIEASGIKGNPYVAVDTSQLPDGTSISFNRSSWSQTSDNAAAISGDLTYSGQPYKVNITFTLAESRWVVSGYSAQ